MKICCFTHSSAYSRDESHNPPTNWSLIALKVSLVYFGCLLIGAGVASYFYWTGLIPLVSFAGSGGVLIASVLLYQCISYLHASCKQREGLREANNSPMQTSAQSSSDSEEVEDTTNISSSSSETHSDHADHAGEEATQGSTRIPFPEPFSSLNRDRREATASSSSHQGEEEQAESCSHDSNSSSSSSSNSANFSSTEEEVSISSSSEENVSSFYANGSTELPEATNVIDEGDVMVTLLTSLLQSLSYNPPTVNEEDNSPMIHDESEAVDDENSTSTATIKDDEMEKIVDPIPLKPLMESTKQLFNPLEKINPAHYVFNLDYVQTQLPIPPLPDDAKDIDINEIETYFREYFKHMQKELLYDDEDNQQILFGHGIKRINTILKVLRGVNGYENYSGLPGTEEGKKQFRDDHTLILKHIIFMIKDLENNDMIDHTFIISTCLANLAVGGSHCATRHSQELFSAFDSLMSHVETGYYSEWLCGDTKFFDQLSFVDQIAFKMLNKELANLRTEAFNTLFYFLYQNHQNARGRQQNSHLRLKLLKAIGKARAIPGFQAARYDDAYESFGNLEYSTEELLEFFDGIYNPEVQIKNLRNRFNGLLPNEKHTVAIGDCYKNHFAESSAHTDELWDEIDWNAVNYTEVLAGKATPEPMKPTPLLQILRHLSLIKEAD